jgi:hypothetical protein
MEEGMNTAPQPASAADEAAGLAQLDTLLSAQCLELGRALGLDKPVPVDVLQAALRQESYAHNLLASRRHPTLLNTLLKNPPPLKNGDASTPPFSNSELVLRAASALLRWGRTGFTTVDQATLERREKACLTCEHLTDPPEQLAYQIASQGYVGKICGLCGCSVKNKMRMSTETCPDRDPAQPGFSRWGEPMKT